MNSVVYLMLISGIVLIAGCLQEQELIEDNAEVDIGEKQPTKEPEAAEIPVEADLGYQCHRCPDVCRDKDDNKIDDLNEQGSCICVEENGECTRKIKQIIYNAPEIKPENFLGPYIGKAAFSDWMDYEPIKQKVKELTIGLGNDMDKAKSIASWVKHSKPYSQEALGRNVFSGKDTKRISPANAYGTIIDIFNHDKGVCLDAAYLTAAMLRLAGIPSMSVQPSASNVLPHQVTYAYIDGKWWQVDSTFGSGDASIGIDVDPQNVIFYDDYDDVAGGMFDVSFVSSYLCSSPYHEETAFSEYNYYLDHPVTLNKYGHTCLPVINKYNAFWENGYLSPKSKDGQYSWLFPIGLSTGESHINLKNDWPNYVTEQKACDDVQTFFGDYLYCLSMPVGKYSATYKEPGSSDVVATLNFEIKDNARTELTSNDFTKHPDASAETYDLFIKYVNKILSYS